MEEDSVRQKKAKALMKERRWEDAISIWNQDVAENPDDPWSVMFLGNCYYSLKRFSAALKCFKHAAKIGPDITTPLGLQGDALLCLGNFEEAKVKYLAALEMEPDSELAIKNWKRFQEIREQNS